MNPETEPRRTIALESGWLASDTPSLGFPYRIEVELWRLITAVQNAGYLVYETSELPEVTEAPTGTSGTATRPKLPARWGEVREGTDERTAYYERAFGQLALARWYEQKAERDAKAAVRLQNDLAFALGLGGNTEAWARHLVSMGWKR